jgi:hypothetical protein
MQTRKRAMQEFTFSFPPTPGLETQTSTSPQPPTMVQPSMLHLLTPESSVSSEPPTPSYLDSLETDQPKKKQRTRRNAKTEEEKIVRAEERAVRNRRAAQESRDRKKKLYDVLEQENERLLAENQHLRERMQRLEERFAGIEDMEVKEVKEVKEEVEEVEGDGEDELARTHPAVVLSLDQQCRASSLSPTSKISSHNSISTSFRRNPVRRYPSPSTSRSNNLTSNTTKTTKRTKRTPPNTSMYSRISSPTTSTHSPECQKIFSPQMTSSTEFLFDSCATFDSLNIGSLDRGAEMTTEASFGEVSLADESFLLTSADAGNLVSDYTCYFGNGLEDGDSKLIHGNINTFY